MQPLIFSNASLPPERQFDALRASCDGIVDVMPPAVTSGGFAACQRIWPLGRLVLASVSLPPARPPLRWTQARKTAFNHWYLLLPCRFIDGQAVALEPAHLPVLHSLAHPHTVALESEGALILLLRPDEAGEELPRDPSQLSVPEGLLALLGDMMLSLANRLPTLDPRVISHAVDALCAVLSGLTSPLHPAGPVASANDLSAVERARQMIRARLKDDALSPELICRDLGVSRSRLYRLFAPFGGISCYIRRQRLMQARHALMDPFDPRPVMAIAEEWGFADASVFSRSFRQEFGASPRDVRAHGPGSDFGSAAARRGGSDTTSTTPTSLAALLRGWG